MKASDPADLPGLFLKGLNARDVDAVAGLYEEGAIVAPDPSQVVRGRTAIRAMLAGFLSGKPRFTLHSVDVVQADDLALVRSRFTVTKPDAAESISETKIAPALVARRQQDGSWLVVIDSPLAGSSEDSTRAGTA